MAEPASMITSTRGGEWARYNPDPRVCPNDDGRNGDFYLRTLMSISVLAGNWNWMGGAVALSLFISGTPAAYAAPFAYVANADDNTASVIDMATHAVVGEPIAVGHRPTDVAINPAGTRVYIANYDEDSISVIDTESNSVLTTITDIQAQYLMMNASGSRLFVAGNYFVAVIDTATNTQVGSPIAIASANATHCPKVSGKMSYAPSAERLYVPARDCWSDVEAPGILSIIDVHAGAAVNNVVVGASPSSATVNADGTRVYVTSWWDSSISVVDVASATATQTIAGGSLSYPTNAVIDPSGTHLYVANNAGGFVTAINTASGSVEGTPITVGAGSYGIAIASDGTRVYTTNESDGSVSVIDTATRTVEQLSIGVGSNPVALALTRSDALFANGFEQQN